MSFARGAIGDGLGPNRLRKQEIEEKLVMYKRNQEKTLIKQRQTVLI